MKLFIELPTWLGDTIMVTPAIDNFLKHYGGTVEITLVGSPVSVAALKYHSSVIQSKVLSKNYFFLYKAAKALGQHDMAISFRRSLRSKVFLFFVKANKKYQFDHQKFPMRHQVEKYNDFVNTILGEMYPPGELNLTLSDALQETQQDRPLAGFNPGASYGSAKRWSPESFAKVAAVLSKDYDIVIFGGPNEMDIANDIEVELKKSGVTCYQNIAGKTTVEELIQKISKLALFVTNDSGPMHIATAFKIPTIAIFGPTNEIETGPWKNPQAIVVRKELDCAPCMQRTCPLGHHHCMRLLNAEAVLSHVN